MRKLVLVVLLVVAGVLVARRVRARAAAPPYRPPSPAPGPADRSPAAAPLRTVAPAPGPPPPTTNGERVVLMSISALQARGQDATVEAVVAHVAAGDIDPDEGAVDVLLHRLAASGLLSGGDGEGPYRLTATGQAALLDGSPARRSPAADAADELSSPAGNA